MVEKRVIADSELLERCLSNKDAAAWDMFVQRFSKLIWSSIHRAFRSTSFASCPEDAEDVFGSIFLSLIEDDFRKLRQFRSRNACKLSTWLAVVSVNRTIDYMRRQSVRPRAVSDPVTAVLTEVVADGARNAEQQLMDAQRSASLARSLACLSGPDRDIYDLLYVKGVSPDDAARAMGTTTAAIYTRKHRLIERLKRSLAEL